MDDYSRQLLEAVDAAIVRWVHRCVHSVAADQGFVITADTEQQVLAAAEAARGEVHERLATLLATDVDQQRGNPLDAIRRSVTHPTAVLRAIGAEPVARDEFAQRMFPDDVYALSPAAFADVDESLVEPGIMWGAWKAKTVLDRRRAEGRLPPAES